jgi:hypothetical protein
MIAAVEAERARIETASATLPETMRAAAVPIVESLGDEIAERTVVAVREDARRAVVDVLASGMEAHAGSMDVLLTEHDKSTKALTAAAHKSASDASSSVQRLEARSMETASVLVRQAMAVSGWSPFRLSAIGLGAISVLVAFGIGLCSRMADDVLQCSVRVQHVAAISRWSPHETNDVRRAICDSVGRGGGASWVN